MSDLRTPNEMARQRELEAKPDRTADEDAELARLVQLSWYTGTALGDR